MSDWNDDEYETSDEELEEMAELTHNNSDQDGVTVTVNARALDTILEAAAHRIATSMEKKVTEMISKRLDALMNQAWRDSVGQMARQAIETYLTKPRVKTNSYGEPVHGTETTISELVPKTVEMFMDAKVNNDGREDQYAKERRLDWIIRTMVTQQVQAETKKAADSVTAKAREVVANHVARFVAQEMVPAIELSRG